MRLFLLFRKDLVMINLKQKMIKPGRFVQVRNGEIYRLTTFGDVIVMETQLVDVIIDAFYDGELKTVHRKNKAWDIMKIFNESYLRYGISEAGGSRLYYCRR